MEFNFFVSHVVTLLINLVYTMMALFLGLFALKYVDHSLLKSVNLEEEIKKGNLAAAIFASTILVFVALIVSVGLKG